MSAEPAVTAGTQIHPRAERAGRTHRILSASWAVALLIVAWQAWITLAEVPATVAPSPRDVAESLITDRGAYAAELRYTVGVASLGLVGGVAIALALAAAAWWSRFLRGVITPAALIVQSVPAVAFIPVIARLMGYDIKTVVVIAVLVSFFPSFVLLNAGLRQTPPGADDLFTVLGGRAPVRLRLLAIPSSIPNLLIALRLAAAGAVLATLVAEFLMGTRGLGHLIALSLSNVSLERAWGAAVLATAISVAAFFAASALERIGLRRWT